MSFGYKRRVGAIKRAGRNRVMVRPKIGRRKRLVRTATQNEPIKSAA